MRAADPGLVRDLGRVLSPQRVLARAIDRVARSRDASIYSLVPEAVVRPQDLGEMRALFAYARAHRRHLTFRGAGTSLSGQAVSDDLLVELGPHWGAFRVLDDGARVWTQPGVVGGHLNRWLAPRHRIGPDPASIDAAMMGGILANNSSGMCCGVAQNSYNTLLSATVLLADGTVVDTHRPGADARLRHDAPALHAGLARLRDDIRADAVLVERIRRKFATKNTTGYSLNAFLDHDAPAEILVRLMVGSEGTLGFVADATLRTIPEPPVRATALLFFADLREAGAAVPLLVEAGAAAIEILDVACLRVMAARGQDVPPTGTGSAALLVEFRSADDAALAADEARAATLLAPFALLVPARFTRAARERAALWKIRKGLAPSTGALRPSGTAFLTEDVAFPVERLAEAIGDCQALFRRHGAPDTILFGHARDGNLHFVLSEDLRRPEAVARYGRFMQGLVELVVGRYDGALKAEHGSGRNMAPFVRTEWGDAAYAAMRRVKQLLDPLDILNPGVILNDDPEAHLRHLKAVPEISAVADACTECGLCEPRCPSRHLTLTPRQRILVTREMAGLASSDGAQARELRAVLEAEMEYDGLETCIGDSACGAVCPVGIDTGVLMKERKALGHGAIARGLAEGVGRGFASATALLRGALALGLAVPEGLRPARPLPAPPRAAGPRVVYFPSCLTRTLASPDDSVALPEALHAVLREAGFDVVHPPEVDGLCCGMPFASRGLEEAARRAGERTAAALAQASEGGRHVVLTDTSPCARTLVDAGVPVLDFPTFWARHALPRLPERRAVAGTAVLHPTCSLVANDGLEDLRRVAAAHSEAVFVPPAAECCGFGGDRGFSVPELTASATREEAREVAGIAAEGHYSTCRTCEIGMTRATGRSYRSVVYLVHEALGLG